MTMSKRPAATSSNSARSRSIGGDEIAGEHQHARLRKQFAHFLFQPLDAGPDGDEGIHRLAFRAFRRMRHGEAAMVADQLLAEAVIDQPGVAVRAGEAEAAGAAQRQRRVAAAVEEKQRLLAALDRGLHRAGERRRDEAAARRPLAAQIDRLDRRHALAAEALGQREPPVAAAPRVDFGLERRRRRRQHHRDLGDMAAHHRHVAGVVVHAVLLLVGRVVLFIDDDQAEIGIGQEQRRARADHDRNFAVGDRAPGARALARRQFRMPFRRAHAEARGEAVEELRGERDLRHQDQALPAAADHLRHRLEIDLGLAGAGDAVDAASPNSRPWRRSLSARRRRRSGRAVKSGGAKSGSGFSATGSGGSTTRLQRAFVDQAVDDAGGDAGLARGFAFARAPCRRREAPARGRAPPSCVAARRRRDARRRARARRRDARPCAGTCAKPCRATPACSSPPSRRSCAVRASAAARRASPRRP